MSGIASYGIPRRVGKGVLTETGRTPIVQDVGIGAYGGYGVTPAIEAQIMDRRNNPFLYLMTGDEMPNRTEPLEPDFSGYADGGVVDAASSGVNAAQLLQFLVSLGNQRKSMQAQSAATDAQLDAAGDAEGGAAGNSALGGAASGNSPASMSGANYGPTSLGMDGLSPGGSPFGTAGKVASNLAGRAIPGAGFVTSLGNSFNAGARSAQLGDFAAQIGGKQPGATIGNFLGGAIGLGLGFRDSDFGKIAMDHNLTPDQAALALDNGIATGNVNMSAAQAAAMPGFGIAGIAGSAASGQSSTGLNMGPSAAAFGQGFASPVGSVGNDGVASYGGTPGDNFGGMDPNGPNAGQEGGQSGSGANSAGGANGEASGANGGGGTGGGDSYARGGMAGRMRFKRGSGLVHGTSGGRDDAMGLSVPKGAYVLPADVVSGLGDGNTMAGAKRLAGMMPNVSGVERFAGGGIADGVQDVPIRVSPGEFVVHPAHVDALGGPEALDRLVAGVRDANARVAQGMPAPR